MSNFSKDSEDPSYFQISVDRQYPVDISAAGISVDPQDSVGFSIDPQSSVDSNFSRPSKFSLMKSESLLKSEGLLRLESTEISKRH